MQLTETNMHISIVELRLLLPLFVLFLSLLPSGTFCDAVSFEIAFGSCMKTSEDQSFWANIANASHQIDLFVGLGDWVYGDSLPLPPVPYFRPGTPASMAPLWRAQREQPAFVEFRRYVGRLVGVVSDHDSSVNDATGADLAGDVGDFVQKQLLDLLGVEQDSFRRRRRGVYAFHKYAMPRRVSDAASSSSVCVLLLDFRFFRDAPRGDGSGTTLGAAQWAWLERVLREERDPDDDSGIDGGGRCALTLVGSDVPILDDSLPMENFAEYCGERERLMRLLVEQSRAPFVLLSGDVHMAFVHELKLPPGVAALSGQRTVVEVTSSGLTHAMPAFVTPALAAALDLEPRPPVSRAFIYTRRSFGRVRIDCADELDPSLCTVRASIHDPVTGAELFVVQPPLRGEGSGSASARSEPRQRLDLPCHWSPLTALVMQMKLHIPGLFLQPRMTALYIIGYVCALPVVVPIVFLLCRKQKRKLD